MRKKRYISFFIRSGFLFIYLLIWNSVILMGQKMTGSSNVSRIMSRIPDSLTYSTDDISNYINAHFTTAKEKSRAAFIWITRNIRYNFDSIITNSISETPPEVSERALKTKTGVCLNFAYLFSELSNKAGIKTYVIQGYTKQYGRVDYLPHMWCASFVDTSWYLYDPSWSAGYYSHGKYINSWGSGYFMRKPRDMIRSHMPFDPLWQFLDPPLSHDDFYRNNIKKSAESGNYNYTDSIIAWENASELERAVGSARRIEQSGVRNNFIDAKLRVIKGQIEFLRNQLASDRYDTAVAIYNKGIANLNSFINLRNMMNAEPDTVQMKNYLSMSESSLRTALEILDSTICPDKQNMASIQHLHEEISNTLMMLTLQKAYLNSKSLRP